MRRLICQNLINDTSFSTNSNIHHLYFQLQFMMTKAASVNVIMLKHNLWFQHVCKQTREHVHLHPIHTFPAIMTVISQSTSVIEDIKKSAIDWCLFFPLCALEFDIKQQNWSPIWMVMVLHGDIIQIQHLPMLVSDFIAFQKMPVFFSHHPGKNFQPNFLLFYDKHVVI